MDKCKCDWKICNSYFNVVILLSVINKSQSSGSGLRTYKSISEITLYFLTHFCITYQLISNFIEYFTCTFDQNSCSQLVAIQPGNSDAEFTWTRRTGQTPTGQQSGLTGPQNDRTGNGTVNRLSREATCMT